MVDVVEAPAPPSPKRLPGRNPDGTWLDDDGCYKQAVEWMADVVEAMFNDPGKALAILADVREAIRYANVGQKPGKDTGDDTA